MCLFGIGHLSILIIWNKYCPYSFWTCVLREQLDDFNFFEQTTASFWPVT